MMDEKYKCPYCGVAFYETPDNTKIDPGEAQKLIKLLELLFKDWYIAQHDREELYNDILAIDKDKQEQRHPD
mgnify:CR=1 FL=1